VRLRWAINGERFPAYVEENLVPALRPGDVVSLDKSKAVRNAIRAGGAMRLPSYSPDLNPIE
jgi:putative transposase